MMITTKQSHSAPVQRCHLSMSLIAAYMLCKMNSVGRGSERLATKRGYLSLVPSRPMICGFQRKRNEQQVHENVALGVRKLNLKWPDAVVGNPCRGGKNLGVGACKMPSAQGVAPSRAQKKGAPALQALVPSAHQFVGCGAPDYRKAHPSNAGRSHWSRHVCWSIACHARRVRLTHCGNQMNMRFVAKRNCLFTSASLLTSFLLSGFVTTGIKFGIDTPPTNWSTRTHAQAGCQPTSLRLIKSLCVWGTIFCPIYFMH